MAPPRRFARLVGQLHAVLPPHRNHELVNGHGSIDGDLAAKVVLDFILLDCVWRVVTDDLGESLDSLEGREAEEHPEAVPSELGLNMSGPDASTAPLRDNF